MKIYIYIALITGLLMVISLLQGNEIRAAASFIVANLWCVASVVVHQLTRRVDYYAQPQWQPIETAPFGIDILVFDSHIKSPRPALHGKDHLNHKTWYWLCDDTGYDIMDEEPKHWMPFPTLPAPEESQ